MARIAIICLVNFVAYFRTLTYGYVSDDLQVMRRKIDEKHYKKKSVPQWKCECGKEYSQENKFKVQGWLHRMYLQFIGVVYFSKHEAHLMTMLLHTLNCVLIYFAFGANDISFFAALLFAINPVNSQGGAVWLSGRIYSFATTLGLAMFILPVYAPVFYGIMKFFSINAIFTPLYFVTTKHWYLALMCPIGLLLFKNILKAKAEAGTNSEMRQFAIRKIIPFFKAFGYYTFLCIVPHTLALYHAFLWGIGVNRFYNDKGYSITKHFFFGVVVFIVMIYAIISQWGSMLSYGLFWYIIHISMWCNFITYQQQISERCVYTANIGLMIFISAVIYQYPLALIAFFIFYITRLWFILPMYTNEYWHTEYSAIEAKKCNYIWIARGTKKLHMGDFPGAFYDFMEARNCIPWEFKANFNAANMAIMCQKLDDAKVLLEEAEKGMYWEQEPMMREKIRLTWEWIKEIEETKKMDATKIQSVR